jgi:outer membrane cobalamin receptor
MPRPRASGRFSSREIALLGLMAALWSVVEITVGGMIKVWHVPFGGSVLAACGVVVLLTARASVPRRWSSLLIGIATAGIRLASGFGGAIFAALGILAESVVVEAVLSTGSSVSRPRKTAAGALALLWALAHPFVVQGYLAGLGPRGVFRFTIAPIIGRDDPASAQAVFAILALVVLHVALGVSMVLFVDRILLAPGARAGRSGDTRGDRPKSMPPATGGGAGMLTVVLVALALALAPGAAPAQTPDDARDPVSLDGPKPLYALPEYTVFGTRLYGPYSVFQLDALDILDAGATDLPEVLELVPGLVVRTDSRGEQRLSARGLAEREITVLVDGVPVSDPYSGLVNLAAVLAGGIGAVRVTKGPAATVYGANAMGGIVEVATPGAERSGLCYMLSGGTDGRYSGHVSGAGTLGRVRLSGGVAARAASDFSLPASFSPAQWEDGGTRDHSAREDLFLWGRAAWSPTDRTAAAISVQVSDGRRDVPASSSASRPRFWSFPFWRETRAVGSLSWRPGSVYLESRLFCSTNDNQLASYADPERTQRRWLSSVANRALGGYLYSELRGIEGQRISAGINVRGDEAGIQSDAGAEWREYEATTTSLFAQDVLAISENDRLAVAMNADVMSGTGRLLARLNPQAAWTHRLGDGVSVRLLGATKTRFPTLKEWFSPEIGNPALKPERCVSGEVEVAKRTVSGSTLSLLVFQQRVTDMIASSGSGDPASNIGSVRSWGAELAVRQEVGEALDVDVALAMTSARDTGNGSYVPLVPRTTCTVSASYARGPLRCVTKVARVGSRTGLAGESLPAYYLMDARGSYDAGWGTLFAGAENVFDILYEDEEGFPQPGRGFEIGVLREFFE